MSRLSPNTWMLRHARNALLAAHFIALLAGCGNGSGPTATNAPQPVLLAAVMAVPTAEQFIVTGLQLLSEKRINRTLFEYTYQVSIKNTGSGDANNVTALLTKAALGSEIVTGKVSAGNIRAGATVTPSGVIVLRQDRATPFNSSALVWQISAAPTTQLVELDPAEVYALSLSELNVPANADSVSVTGAVSNALLSNGTLRFATPGDSGVNQYAEFILKAGTATTTLRTVIRSSRPVDAEANREPSDDGSLPPVPPALTITGLGPNNSFINSTIKFKLDGVATLDLKEDSNGLILAPDNVSIALKSYWVYNAADTSFSISGNALLQLLSALPPGALNVGINFVSKDAEFAANYNFLAIKANARLSGKFVTPQREAVTGLSGRKVLLKGYNSHLRRVAPVDANGAFVFDGVVPDSYQLTLDDLDHPNVITGGVTVVPASTEVRVSIPYFLGAISDASSSPAVSIGSKSMSEVITKEIPANLSENQLSTTFTAQSIFFLGGENLVWSIPVAPVAFTVPIGTHNVGFKVSLYTGGWEESNNENLFIDNWSYSINGIPGIALSESGILKHPLSAKGLIVKSTCVDVGAYTKNSPLLITGSVAATGKDIRDIYSIQYLESAHWAVTQVKILVPCNGLKITLAKFSTPNSNSHPILNPINEKNNLIGPYVSIPLTKSESAHTIPLEIEFIPVTAQINEINFGVSPIGGNIVFFSENFFGQANMIGPGKIRIPSLSLPAFPDAKDSGKLNITVRIKGSVDGVNAVSNPDEGGQIALKGETAFTPLYLAGNESNLAGRRYGTRDTGGDSWTTFQSIQWLGTNAFRFDDISGQHVAQISSGRSVLGHSGHSDGQQFDLRYADGQGGYSDALGGQSDGAAIKSLIDDAAAEVANNSIKKPKLASLQSWINANRSMLQVQADGSNTRTIYIGSSFITSALVHGKFPIEVNKSIPGVAAWILPAKIRPDPNHLSHWHLSLTAHP